MANTSKSNVELARKDDQLRTIAKYLCHGLAPKSICESIGISQGRLSQLRQQPQFAAVFQEVSEEMASDAINTDEHWGKVESIALGNLLKMMEYNMDPNLNLRVAMVANRANRRMRPGNKPLDASNGTGRVQLTLTRRIVEKLNKTDVATPESKDANSSEELEDTREMSMSLKMSSVEAEEFLADDSNSSMIPTFALAE